MLAIGLVLNTLGIGLFCWAIFALAVYALPFFVALTLGITAFQGGAGIVAALLVGTASGALTLVTRSGRHRGRSVLNLAHCHRDRICYSGHRRWLSLVFALPRSGCLRWLGERSTLAWARSLLATQHGHDFGRPKDRRAFD
jgi:hypothetical protein